MNESESRKWGPMALELENFQSIRDRVRIDLAALTLFFGPNSAGKSAVLDAFELLRCYWGRLGDWHSKVVRWTHAPHRLSVPDRSALQPIRLALECWTPRPIDMQVQDAYEDLAGAFGELSSNLLDDVMGERNYPIRVEVEFDPANELKVKFEIAMNGLWICKLLPIKTGGEGALSDPYPMLALNHQHPLLAEAIRDADGNHSALLTPKLYGDARLLAGPHSEKVDQVASRWRPPFEAIWIMAYDKGIGMGAPDVDAEIADSRAWRIFTRLHKLLVIFVGECIRHNALQCRVPASRIVPLDKDLTYEFGLAPWQLKPDTWSGDPDGEVPSPLGGDRGPSRVSVDVLRDQVDFDAFAVLAIQAVLSSRESSHRQHARHLLGLAESSGDSIEQDVFKATLAEHLRHGPADLIAPLNDFLREDLFVDNGYQILPEVVKLPKHVSPQIPDEMVAIMLRDNHQRTVSLGDVGSGIGYVIPAIVGPLYKDICFVEQPELHLHPAMQAALGDVYARVKNSRGGIVILETHSEHLLLRLLRRVRETSKGLHGNDELLVRPDDLAIYYFNPGHDGATTVKKLRLTPEGEFMDRWPRGFFTEREEDLFDE